MGAGNAVVGAGNAVVGAGNTAVPGNEGLNRQYRPKQAMALGDLLLPVPTFACLPAILHLPAVSRTV